MDQSKIWDHFQNEGQSDAFSEARPKYISAMLRPDQKVLNIGIGNGILERICVHKKVDIHVLDPNERAICKSRDDLGLGDKARVGFAQHNPFQNNYFDVVVMSEVLEHLEDGILEASLNEAYRVLKSGGLLWVSTPYQENLNIVKTVCPNCGDIFHRFGHVQSFDIPKITQKLQEANFKVTNSYISTFIDWDRRGVKNFVKSLAKLIMAKMGETIADPHIIALARK